MDNKLIFIGGVGKTKEFGGELTKNKFLITYLKPFFDRIFIVDTYKSRKNPLKIFILPFLILFCSKIPIIFSTSYRNISWLHLFLFYFYPKRKLVLWAIGGDLHKRIKNGTYKLKYFNGFSAIIVEGELIQKELNLMGLKNVFVIPNFKLINYIPDIAEKITHEITYFKFVFFSRIIPEKGVEYIITAAEILNIKGFSNNYCIDFYGPIDPVYESEFLKKIDSFTNVNYCHCLDFNDNVSYDKLSTYHLTLFPTYWSGEGFPGVIIDSYIAGLPILASDWNLNKEIIQKDTGFIIPPHDVFKMVEIMEKIISKDIDLKPMFSQTQKKSIKYDIKEIISKELIKSLGFNLD